MKNKIASFLLSLLSVLALTPAKAIDVGPADYTYMPAGTNLGLLYYQYLSSETLTIKGADVPNSSFRGNVGLLRGLSYVGFGEETLLFQFVLPFAHLPTANISGSGQSVSNGFGDLTLGVSYWPIKPSNPETGTTLGLSLFVTTPTGKYDMDDIGIGEGTWSFTPQAGLIQGLGNGFFFEAIADAAFYTDHTENGISVSRENSYQLQTMLRKQLTPTSSVAIGYSGQFGGEQKMDGVETGMKIRRDQLRLYASTFLTKDFQIQGMLARDIYVEGGFEYDLVGQIRLMKMF